MIRNTRGFLGVVTTALLLFGLQSLFARVVPPVLAFLLAFAATLAAHLALQDWLEDGDGRHPSMAFWLAPLAIFGIGGLAVMLKGKKP